MPKVQRRAQAHEERVAKDYGGKRVPGSGSGWARKGDVRTPELAIEHKFTDKRSYSIKEADLLKHWSQALIDGRTGVFMVKLPASEWVVLRKGDFDDLVA